MQSLEHSDSISPFSHISRKRKSTRARTDYGYFHSVTWLHGRESDLSRSVFIIGSKTLQITDSDRFFFQFLSIKAFRFTLTFLWTYSPTHRRQSTRFFQRTSRRQKITPFYIFNKFWYIDPNRTTSHTKRLYAIEATSSLQNGLFTCKPTIHLFPISYAVSRIELFHFHPRYIGTLLSLSTSTQLFSPFFGTLCR